MTTCEIVDANVKHFVSYRNGNLVTTSLRKKRLHHFLAIVVLPLYETNISRNF